MHSDVLSNHRNNSRVNEVTCLKPTLPPSFKLEGKKIEAILPIVTASEGNGGARKTLKYAGKTRYRAENWRERHKRHKQQAVPWPITVTLSHNINAICPTPTR